MADLKVKVPGIELQVSGIKKLVDYAASGVGAVAGPMLANWRASKEGQARLTAARFDAQVSRIEAEYRADSLVIIAEAQAEARQSFDTTMVAKRGGMEITSADITQSIEFQGRKRLANASSVVDGAADELGDKEVPDHEPDPDWAARFFDCVQDVSSEDMQKLWSRVLAGEVESPGRTSLRTLETLRNMTKMDADLFNDMCNFVVGDDFVFYDDSVKGFRALSYNNLLHLQDFGLVSLGAGLRVQLDWIDDEHIVLLNRDGGLLIRSSKQPIERLAVPAIRLTSVGGQLNQFVESRLSIRYLRAFSHFLKSKGCALSYLEGVVQLANGTIHYTKSTAIEPKPERLEEKPT